MTFRLCLKQTNDSTVSQKCTGTSSVEDKLDADGRSVWVGNVSFCFASAAVDICGRYFIICSCLFLKDCCYFQLSAGVG